MSYVPPVGEDSRVELLKACFVELPKDKQVEFYRWVHQAFDYCRVYEK